MANPFDEDDDDFRAVRKPAGGFGSYTKPSRDFDEAAFYEQQIEAALQSSLSSTGRSIAALQEAEEVGLGTAQDLIVQGEKLQNVDRKLGEIQDTTRQTQRHLSSLKSVFGSMKNYFSKDKAAKAAAAALAIDEPSRTQRPRATDLQTTVDRIKEDTSGGLFSDNPSRICGGGAPTLSDSTRQSIAGTRWGAMNDEIEDNLGIMEGNLRRLKELGLALGEEVQQQNDLIDNVARKADKTNLTVDNQNRQMTRLLGSDKKQKKATSLPDAKAALKMP
ncbi:hypothetical protein M514_08307 [Trichuris suis]|uniref:t-SNARE coiled-coil homology domain-containing protein n=1 Tax=Trichuris suis TaxID=68888 RepID=A0A085NHK3_9BILA|nr:hypothetical protein M513_08307 [Trichuris suis]KFD68949.1 hypothetical protein M514_08307 [Trichuris suis]